MFTTLQKHTSEKHLTTTVRFPSPDAGWVTSKKWFEKPNS